MFNLEPTLSAEAEDIRRALTETRTIAVIGLSPDPTKDSNMVARYLQQAGYRIIPVYPKENEILGEKVYRSLAEIPDRVDMVDIFRKAEFIDRVVDEVLEREDVRYVWVQLGLVNNPAAARATAAGRVVVQNLCSKVEHQKIFAAR
ncbi:MAG: CoA-binding protein [Deltaproteobacteria bacterium]|nr:CoA-binding protein [Deltaproteobacteria bacterium]